MTTTFKLINMHNIVMLGKAIPIVAMLMFALVICVSPLPVQAAPYNTTDNPLVFPEGYAIPYNQMPIDPKIACSESNPDLCFLAFYDLTYDIVHTFISLDVFQTTNECISGGIFGGQPDGINCFSAGTVSSVGWTSWATSQRPYYHLPFDVVWSGKSSGNVSYDTFYFAVEDKVYRFEPGADTLINDGAAPDIPQRVSTYTCGGSFTCREVTDLWCCGWDNDDPEVMFVCGGGYHENYNTPYYDKYVHSANAVWNISASSTFSDYSRFNAGLSNCLCPYGGVGCPTNFYINNVTYYSGAFQSDNGFGYTTRTGVYSRWDFGSCANTRGYTYDNSNFTEPSGTDSSQHELSYNLYTMNVSNGSILSHGIIGDYSSIGAGVPVYQSDISGIYEVINWSDSELAAGTGSSREYISWYRSSNTTGDGIYVYQNPLNTILISYDPSYSVSASLACVDEGYSTTGTGSGGILRLGTPCSNNENNTIVLFSDKEPAIHTFNVSFNTTACPNQYIVYANYEDVPFDIEFTVRSRFEAGIPVSGANVTIDGYGTQQTDGSGKTTFTNVNPLFNTDFGRVTYTSDCIQRRSMTADVDGLTFIIDKTGYTDYVDYDFITASYTEGGVDNEWSFVTTNTTLIDITGTILNVSLVTGDGVYFEPCNYYVEVSGANLTRVGYGGDFSFGDSSTRFFSLFRLEDNRSYWNETISVLAPDGTWYNETINVSADEQYDVPIYITENLNTLSCDAECDCPGGTCIGGIYYDYSSCTDNTCTYEETYCEGGAAYCDDCIGCFDEDTTIACTSDDDCPSTCVTDYAMEYGLCGCDGFCKNITQECLDFCNQTAGYCDELIACKFGDTELVSLWGYPTQNYEGKRGFGEATHTCDISNVGERVCVGGERGNGIPKVTLDYYGLTVNDLYSTHDEWTYTIYVADNGQIWYNFSSLIFSCNDTCNVNIEWCDGGCDYETAECLSNPGSIENIIYSLLPSWLQWLLTSMVLWTFFSLVIGAVLTFLPAKFSNHAQPTPQLGLSAVFIMYILGIGLGFVNPLIGLLIVIGLGLALAKMISDMISS